MDNRPDYDYVDGVSFHIFAMEDGASAARTVYTVKGQPEVTLTVVRDGGRLTARTDRTDTDYAQKDWNILLRGIHKVSTVENGSFEDAALGLRVIPKDFHHPILINL